MGKRKKGGIDLYIVRGGPGNNMEGHPRGGVLIGREGEKKRKWNKEGKIGGDWRAVVLLR